MHSSSSVALELEELPDHHDIASIVELLRTRHQLGLGHVAISSSKMITLESGAEDGSLYSREASEYFLEKGFNASSSHDHVFGLASNVFRTMLMENADQEVLICGDDNRWVVSKHFLKLLLITSKFVCPEHEPVAIKIMSTWELLASFFNIVLTVDLQFNAGHLKGAVIGVDNLGCSDAGWFMTHLASEHFVYLLKVCKFSSNLLLVLDEIVKIVFQALCLIESAVDEQILASRLIAKTLGFHFKDYKSKLSEIEAEKRKPILFRFVITSFLGKLADLINEELTGKDNGLTLIKLTCGKDRTRFARRRHSKKLFDPDLHDFNFNGDVVPYSPQWLVLVVNINSKEDHQFDGEKVLERVEHFKVPSLLADVKTHGYHSTSLDVFCRKYRELIKIHLERDSFVEEVSLIYGLGENDLLRQDDLVVQSRTGLKRLDSFCKWDPLQQIAQCLPSSSLSDNHAKQKKNIFRARKVFGSLWRAYAWLCTCLIPDALLIHHLQLRDATKLGQHNRLQAWREKLGFCLFILSISVSFLVFMIGTTRILCPSIYTSRSLREFYGMSRGDAPYVLVNGRIYNVGRVARGHTRNGALEKHVWRYAGEDASFLFPRPSKLKIGAALKLPESKPVAMQPKVDVEESPSKTVNGKGKKVKPMKGKTTEGSASKIGDLRVCGENTKKRRKRSKRRRARHRIRSESSSSASTPSALSARSKSDMKEKLAPVKKETSRKRAHISIPVSSPKPPAEKPFVHSLDALLKLQTECKSFDLVLTMENMGRTEGNPQIVVFGRVYGLRELIAKGKESGLSEKGMNGIRDPWGVDRSEYFASYDSKEDLALLEDYYAGSLDQRDCLACRLSSHLIVGSSFFLLAIVLIKLFAAFQQLLWVPRRKRTTTNEEGKKPGDKFVIIQVPCFTEGKEALRATLNSLVMLRYDDKRKLLFIVADGVVTGKGNGRATSEILKELLGIDSGDEPPAFAYQSVTTGVPSLNRCQVYSGLYECSGQRIPFVLLAKIGSPSEAEDRLNRRPGNRGKRDSQMILFRFLGRLFHRQPFCPLEAELYRHIRWIVGIDPSLYEFVMMVDADTQVHADAVSRMVEMYEMDHRLVGVCGESRLSNEKATWVTAVQVYEYFVSHNINKAFESLFGSVTCLPGCFCMYRIKDGASPYLVHPTILANYGKSNVASLHWKNLLSLGEDRYLTTLMLKHFPEMRLEYCPRAVCWTAVPESWPVLLSQRRRWINSTVHNLVELLALPRSLFSLRFVVILDLLGTLLMPAGLIYLACLLYESVAHQHATSTLSLLLLVAVYALQSLIFMARREWQYIGWLGIHILAIPLSGFVIPLYAYWRYDELGWGATRKVYGSSKRTQVLLDGDDHAEVAEVMRLKPYSEYSKDPERQPPWPAPRSPMSSPSAEAFLAQLFQSADLSMMTKRQARALLAEHLGLDPQRHAAHLDSLIEHYIHSVYT